MLPNLINIFFSKIFQLPKNSVIIIYQGGLGNQLFQYFLGRELEKLYKKNVYYFDFRENYRTNHNSNIENLFELNLRKYNFGKFNLFLRFIFLSPKVLKFKKFVFQNFKFKILSNYYFDLIDKTIDLNKVCVNENIMIFFGTWHNLINKYKYPFDLCDLKFKKNIYLTNSFNFNEKFISLHVRRGDYCNSRTASFHGNLDINYFLKGVSFLRNKFGNLPVLIFSDEPKWIKNNLSNKIPNSFIISSPKTSPEIDFYIMTKGNHFILSNSTFAWLSAFFSETKDKFVVLPKFWFKNEKINSFYIYKDWKFKII